MKRKMNGLYKTAFILMLVAAALFIAATIVAYALDARISQQFLMQRCFSCIFGHNICNLQ
ncbi:hypothetical protein DW960_06910 [Ruminococcus bromii]|nr:hypothetical protein DW960_06910 [Ruminococcus bromii]